MREKREGREGERTTRRRKAHKKIAEKSQILNRFTELNFVASPSHAIEHKSEVPRAKK